MKNIIALKNKLKNAHKQGLALDIDGVLSWTGTAWVKQLQKKFGNPENLTVAQIIKKYHFTKNIPYWQTPQVQIFKDKLEKSNDLQKNLPLIKDSLKFVQNINIIPCKTWPVVLKKVKQSYFKFSRN